MEYRFARELHCRLILTGLPQQTMPVTMQKMFSGITVSAFDNPEFKEDSVRELIILPILNRLGYLPTGSLRVARSKSLKHPFITIGTRSQPVTMVPDYTFYSDDKAIFVLDAKAPSIDLLDRKHVQQAYSYASHPEVKCQDFGLCNGRRLVVFNVDKTEPLLDLRFEEFETKWELIEKFLSARFLLQPQLRKFSPDFGMKLKRLGFSRDTDLVFVGVRLNLFAKVSDKLFTATSNCTFDDKEHCVSYDFHRRLLPEIVSGLPKELRDMFCRALGRAPFQAAAGLAIEIDITTHLGKETRGSDEVFIPLGIVKVHASRFNPAEVPGDPKDTPANVFQLRRAFTIQSPA